MNLGNQSTEYEISYAYPSSENAYILGMSNGGFCVRVGDVLKGFSLKLNAMNYAKTTGLPPSRWSIDNPAA
jgi:hypothetical protein